MSNIYNQPNKPAGYRPYRYMAMNPITGQCIYAEDQLELKTSGQLDAFFRSGKVDVVEIYELVKVSQITKEMIPK